jgi:hypothetical protein
MQERKPEHKDAESNQAIIDKIYDAHYKMTKGSEWFSDGSKKLHVSEDSKRLFRQGKPGQGYVGLVDLKTGVIHLLPSFNFKDGLLHEDNDGKAFNPNEMVESRGALGVLGGDLHTQAGLRRIKRPGSTKEKLGFGIWKGGCSVKILEELPQISGRIPFEYLLIKSPTQDEYELHFVEDNRELVPIDITRIDGLKDVNCIANHLAFDAITPNDKKLIESLIRTAHGIEFPDMDENHIKFAKNRSTSQNRSSLGPNSKYAKIMNGSIVSNSDFSR